MLGFLISFKGSSEQPLYSRPKLHETTLSSCTTECRSTLYYNSFVPAVIRKWNILPDDVKNSESLNIFKSKLNRTLVKTPAYYYVGKRYLQLTHTRLRTKSSALNDHLFAKKIISSPRCSCGAIETTNHIVFLMSEI